MVELLEANACEVLEGVDPIDRAAYVAEVVTRIATRRKSGEAGIGVISSRSLGRSAHVAAAVAKALGFKSLVLDGDAIDWDRVPEGTASAEPLAHATLAELADEHAMFISIDMDFERHDTVRRATAMVTAALEARPAGARTAVLTCMRGESYPLVIRLGQTLRMDVDDIALLII